LVMHYADRAALMTALDQDMASLLTGSGAQVLENSGNDRDGFHFRYAAGKSVGTVIIKPPETIADAEKHLGRPLCPGEIDVWVRLNIEETWYRSGAPMPQSKQSLLPRL